MFRRNFWKAMEGTEWRCGVRIQKKRSEDGTCDEDLGKRRGGRLKKRLLEVFEIWKIWGNLEGRRRALRTGHRSGELAEKFLSESSQGEERE